MHDCAGVDVAGVAYGVSASFGFLWGGVFLLRWAGVFAAGTPL